jgi:hypothetical protein
MSEIEVCAECGTQVTTRNVDVTSLADTSRVYEEIAYNCPNRDCENNNTRNHTFSWAVSKAEYDATHPA